MNYKPLLKVFKHLFYDIIPEFYDVKWYKKDFDYKIDYYCQLPFIYIFMLIVSSFDIRIVVYRIVFIFGFMKYILFGEKKKVVKNETGIFNL